MVCYQEHCCYISAIVNHVSRLHVCNFVHIYLDVTPVLNSTVLQMHVADNRFAVTFRLLVPESQTVRRCHAV